MIKCKGNDIIFLDLNCLYIVCFGGENLNNVSGIINGMKIKQRTDGRYEGRITVDNYRKSFYGKTKGEIKQKAKEYLTRVENGYREPRKITLNEFIEYWLVTYKYGKIEPSSYTRLHRVYLNQIHDTIGKQMIGDITTSKIQQLIDNYANPKDNDRKPLALSGLKKIIQLLNPCLKMAVKEGIICNNPCEDAIVPSESYITRETKQQYSLTDKEIADIKSQALLKCNNKDEYISRNALIILLILNLGLRAGEILALEWDDIDFKNCIVSINKTVQCGIRDFDGNNETVIYNRIKKSTKTVSGRRTLKLNDAIIFYLQEIKRYDNENGIASKYVCCTKNGKMSNHRNLQKCLDRLSINAQINKRVTLHTLRHTFGSTLIRRGVRIETISKLMGHANITITYNKYIHTIQEEEAKAMDMITVC